MTAKEHKTIKAYYNEYNDFKLSGYRFVERFPEPNSSFSVVMQHPHTLRRLTLVVQPSWGLVLIKEGTRVLKCINIS